MSSISNSINYPLASNLINNNHSLNTLEPRLIVNNEFKKEFLQNVLQHELSSAQSFFFSIAFVTPGGLNTIKTQLSDLNRRGVKGKLITSNYLAFNHPNTFRDLLKIPNLEVRISEKAGFHSKGYFFDHGAYQSLIVGSSNLTMSALKTNYEWNVRLTSSIQGEIIAHTIESLNDEWSKSVELSESWIDDYAESYIPLMPRILRDMNFKASDKQSQIIVPNKMQTDALASLQHIRELGESKSLVISATGTGKTYLAAFDVKNFNPDRMLFIVHREQIIDDAIASFKQILGGDTSDYGKLTGTSKNFDAKYLFTTNQSIAINMDKFNEEDFDYIIIDEAHRAAANTYVKALNYFNPEFLLGITATPERTDDFNVFELFDYNIAYEIRLQDALEEDLLTPFHYFGVTEFERDGVVIEDDTDINDLVLDERVDFILEKIDYYCATQEQIVGLIFCSRVDEAKELSRKFNERGFRTVALSGEDSNEYRKEQVRRLEEGEIQFIFTVDIFNEGIDIPKINQIIMLRGTQSKIIFTQQIGRGLRKHDSKDFVTIIDFIGNYENNYLIPQALVGSGSGNKDGIRREVVESGYVSGLSAINFEEIAKERIFSSIDTAKIDSMANLRKGYKEQQNRLDRIPMLQDFYRSRILDPIILAGKYKNYYEFLKKIKEIDFEISKESTNLLYFLSSEILPGKRLHEVVLIKYLIEENERLTFDELKKLLEENKLDSSDLIVKSVIKTLTLDFYVAALKKAFDGGDIIAVSGSTISISEKFSSAIQDSNVLPFIKDILETALLLNKEYENDRALTLNEKYSRRDITRFLGFDKQIVDLNIGGYFRDHDTMNFIIFITLHKGDDFKGAEIAYEDEILDQNTIHWYTKSKRNLDSPEVQTMLNPEAWNIHMFLKKSDDEGSDFYYLGEVSPIRETIEQVEKPTSDGKLLDIVNMNLHLSEPISTDLFEYLTL